MKLLKVAVQYAVILRTTSWPTDLCNF